MDRSTAPAISPQDVYRHFGTAAAPVVIDVRPSLALDADQTLIAGAIRRPPSDVASWCDSLPRARPVVVYCMDGAEMSRGVAAELHRIGIEANYLTGGIDGWIALGLPRRRKVREEPSVWITRERPKIDRIACPWLVHRFIDPEATFAYVPTTQVLSIAKDTGATAYDIPGAEPFSHEGDLCSFDAFLKVYGIVDRALDRLALIVRGADTGRLELTPQSAGLLAISLGLSANFPDDHAMLAQGMRVYDALYTWCRSLQDEHHNWTPAA
jgi:rhodanese-related sulfurtransferase